MKRICIYVIYDKQNKVNPYVGEVLKEIKKYFEDIWIVCNFSNISEGEEYVRKYSDNIFFRENIGFDSGAYKDMITQIIQWEKLSEYDELLLSNDTYFAPIYPFEEMISTMENSDCDYWGITRHPGGYIKEIGEFDAHLQSYFLCFKNEILHSKCFRSFWSNYLYANNKWEAIAGFEIGLNKFLVEKGFRGLSYMEKKGFEIKEKDINPYAQYAYELVKDYRIPIIKKTNFYGNHIWQNNINHAVAFIEENTLYNFSLIKDYIEEYKKKGLIGTYFDFNAMNEFVQLHKRIFVYGAGVWGGITKDYLENNHLKFDGFIVTKADNKCKNEFSKMIINKDDGIIIAQEYEQVCQEIMEYIGARVDLDQIFIPCFPTHKRD